MTRRDRTVLRTSIRRSQAAKLAVVVLGGCVALAACGPVQLGAAAIVGGQRITTSTLTTEVSNLNQAYLSSKPKVTLGFSSSKMPQEVLSWLIIFRVGDRLASREHITVTATQVQGAINSLSAELKSSGGGTLRTAAISHGIPPNLISTDFATYEATQNALIVQLSHGQTSQTAQQAVETEFNHEECVAAKSLKIKISPQFGRLDYSQFSVVPVANTLSAPEPSPSPSASATSKPEYNPPC